MPDSFDDMWELVEFQTSEALALRAFLEYLRAWPDPLEKKLDRLEKWRTEVGLQFGSPEVAEPSKSLFQKLRQVPPEIRATLVKEVIGKASSIYFGENTQQTPQIRNAMNKNKDLRLAMAEMFDMLADLVKNVNDAVISSTATQIAIAETAPKALTASIQKHQKRLEASSIQPVGDVLAAIQRYSQRLRDDSQWER